VFQCDSIQGRCDWKLLEPSLPCTARAPLRLILVACDGNWLPRRGLSEERSFVSCARRVELLTAESWGTVNRRGEDAPQVGHSAGSENCDIGAIAENGPQLSHP